MGRGTDRQVSWELERPSLAMTETINNGHEARLPITGRTGKWKSSQQGVGGGHMSKDGHDNTT